MGHHHHHDHDHEHSHVTAEDLPRAADLAVPDAELNRAEMTRRSVFRRAGLLGAGLAGGSVLNATPAAATPQHNVPRGGFRWLAGDHHVHTQYSDDGKYRVIDHVRQANAYGLGWLVITDHGGPVHAKIGVDKVNPDIKAAREKYDDTLVFQGLEWNIPGAEHGTVFVAPGRNEASFLKEFELGYDGRTNEANPNKEALAIAGVNFLSEGVRRRRVDDALMLANHPARKGIDSPHEIRAWRDTAPNIAVGMEGAPGHQAAGIPKPHGGGRARGYYDGIPGSDAFAGYPPESYYTWGGFDWLTSTVGGMWDSLLSEGKPWWITANSDSHSVYADSSVRGPNSNYAVDGKNADPVHGGPLNLGEGDFWPGCYSRTHVGALDFSYRAVMDGIRAGRVWVDHGGLISGLDVRLRSRGSWLSSATLGGSLHVRRGTPVELTISIDLANTPNWAQFVPVLSRVDIIQGDVTGPVQDRDTFTAPRTKVVKSFEVNKSAGTATFTYQLGRLDRPVYVRLRGTDGNRVAPGFHGAAVDPHGPAIDKVGDADPWKDLWFYTNPIWALPY
ncbi:PHP domain-containing protein [Kibdelosporangium philippinense]|uniref:PHP domain-containing protein n=1 Tax=Kibdelosporangium philippinense TaxID=211113 RepID=A0ABS8ZSK8_9PSEU|nr:PHP domain-containing protein [Kibdelosporangium philippinense]MCE7010714.1 PHP domain-containing protein [Kibdelosporangium philippinense]